MLKISFTKFALFIIFALLISSFKGHQVVWVDAMTSNYSNKAEFISYWYNSPAMKNYEEVKKIPQEVILAKMWLETNGGMAGAGKRGAIFGIKGSGIKGYDNVDKENVEYQSYDAAWQAISHFVDLINNDPDLVKAGIDKIDRSLYYNRFQAWQKLKPNNEEWENWLLALQVHPQLQYSKLAYAMCGCKDGTDYKCYLKRRKHALKGIQWVKKNLK